MTTTWSLAPLSSVTTRIGSGITPRGGSAMYHRGGRPFIRSQNVGWGQLHLSDLAYIDDETHNAFRGSEIRTDDVLLNITGASIGRAAIASDRLDGGNVNQHVCEIRLNTKRMDPRFVCQFLLSRAGQSQIAAFQAGGNREGLNFKQVGSIQVPMPDLSEQIAIGTALSDADRMTGSLEALIAKKQAALQGMMSRLLTGQTRLPGFSSKWQSVRLGDHVKYVKTVALSRAQLDSESPIRYLHYGDIHTTALVTLDAARVAMPRVAHALAKGAGRLEPGDLVFADASEDPAGVGKAVEIISVPSTGVVPGLHTIAARFDKSVLADGFKAYLPFIPAFRVSLLRLAAGTKVLATTRSQISSIALDLPEVDEQRAIAAALSDASMELDALRARLSKSRHLKQGMMQALLTGRMRLPDLEPVA